MAGSTISDRLVAKGIRGPRLPYALGVSGRKLLLLLAAPIVVFGIAFAAGAGTRSGTPAQAQLAPATRSTAAQVRIVSVTPVPATPALKTPPKPRAAPNRSAPKSAP